MCAIQMNFDLWFSIIDFLFDHLIWNWTVVFDWPIWLCQRIAFWWWCKNKAWKQYIMTSENKNKWMSIMLTKKNCLALFWNKYEPSVLVGPIINKLSPFLFALFHWMLVNDHYYYPLDIVVVKWQLSSIELWFLMCSNEKSICLPLVMVVMTAIGLCGSLLQYWNKPNKCSSSSTQYVTKRNTAFPFDKNHNLLFGKNGPVSHSKWQMAFEYGNKFPIHLKWWMLAPHITYIQNSESNI